MSYAILIPARLGSTRLPEKVLLAESGKPLIQHVVEAAAKAEGAAHVIVCTDSERVAEAVRGFGGRVVMTRADHVSGTDRCAEVAATLDVDVVVNLQGDEPFVVGRDIAALAAAAARQEVDLATLAHPFADETHRADPAAVKALRGPDGFARGFQRADPGPAAAGEPAPEVLHHLGLYAFRRERLASFTALPPSAGEKRERLEQLRALDAGWKIAILDASAPAFGIDTPEDYARFLGRIRPIS